MNLFGMELPPGLVYVDNWLSGAAEAEVVRAIDSGVFDTSLSRRTQHYGFIYDYSAAEVNTELTAPSPPAAIERLAVRLRDEGHFHRVPDQVIVNEYLSGQGIAEHVDRLSFGPAVATVSLLESWPMVFSHPDGRTIEVVLARGSLAVMTGPSRNEWTHEIRKRKSDSVGGMKVPRGRRLSVTFRTVNAAD